MTIDYFFTSVSPYAYLGHRAVMEVAARHGASLSIRPVLLSGVWEVSGSVPLAKRSPTRQRYRNLELQRASFRRNLPVNLQPRFFPVDPTLADHVVIALLEDGVDPTGFMSRVFAGVWAHDENIGDPEQLARYLETEGRDAKATLAAASSAEVAAIRRANTDAAIAADAVGVPAYVLNGEVFWGQDRIDDLDLALSTKRAPFRA